MAEFPRTMIEDLSVSRMIIGSNWFLGYSHTSGAKDKQILAMLGAKQMADILEVFLKAGVDTLMAPFYPPSHGPQHQSLCDAIKDAQDRTGRKLIVIATPGINTAESPDADAENQKTFDTMAANGASVCLPHTSSTDAMVDVRARKIRNMDRICAMIRQRRMIPGLSTHMPEAIVYADESNLDVGTYIAIYNAIGFLMHIEVDWIHKLIWRCKHPVLTIKPMAAGRLLPLVGLAFVWSTIRDCDMVTVGTMTPDEARELIEISLSILQRRPSEVQLQRTRSKQSVEAKK
jgi:hypothetical protein